MSNFVPKCLGCKQTIVDTYIQALGGHYHKNCFVCQVNINQLASVNRDDLSQLHVSVDQKNLHSTGAYLFTLHCTSATCANDFVQERRLRLDHILNNPKCSCLSLTFIAPFDNKSDICDNENHKSQVY